LRDKRFFRLSFFYAERTELVKHREFIAIAEITGAHGVNGGVRIRPYNPESPLFSPGTPVYMQTENGDYAEYEILEVADLPKGMRLILDGFAGRDEAKALFQQQLFYPRDMLPETDENENYVEDLLGLRVIDIDSGAELGVISDIFETGANDCWEIKNGDREIIIPATREVIVEVDIENSIVRVKLPEGLAEVYED